MNVIICRSALGAPAWFDYAMEGWSYPMARLLAARDWVLDRTWYRARVQFAWLETRKIYWRVIG